MTSTRHVVNQSGTRVWVPGHGLLSAACEATVPDNDQVRELLANRCLRELEHDPDPDPTPEAPAEATPTHHPTRRRRTARKED